MAIFNPTPDEINPPDQSRNSGGPIVNRTLGTLFEGVGNVVAAGAQVFDFRNQYNLREDIRTGVEIIRDQYGVNAGSDTAGNSLFDYSTSPEGLNQAHDEIDRLTQAYQNGTLRESYYYAQLNSLVRSVKSRYPGYEDEIDAAVGSITGIDPANAYISQLRQEALADAQASGSDTDGLRAYITAHEGELESIYPGFHNLPWDQQLALVTPGNPEGLRDGVANFARAAAEAQYIDNELSADRITTTQALEQNLSLAFTTWMDGLEIGIGEGDLADPDEIVQELIRRGATGPDGVPITEITGAVQYLQGLVADQEALYNEILNDPRYTTADKERAREMIADFTGTFNFYIEAVMNGDTGMAAMAEYANQLGETVAYQTVNDAFGGMLPYLNAISENIPDTIMAAVGARNLGAFTSVAVGMVELALENAVASPTMHPEVRNALIAAGITPPVAGQTGVNTWSQFIVNTSEGDPVAQSEAFEAILNLQLDKIRGTGGVTATPQQITEAVNFLFINEGGFDFTQIPPEEYQAVYETLTSRAVAEAVVAVGGDTQAAYEDWAIRNFRVVNFADINELNTVAPDNQLWTFIDLAFNEGTGQLEIRPKEGVDLNTARFAPNPRNGALGLPAGGVNGTSVRFTAEYETIQNSVDAINQSLGGVRNLYNAAGAPMGLPEFNELTQGQLTIGVPVVGVNEPRGLASLEPDVIGADGETPVAPRTVQDIDAANRAATMEAPIPPPNPERLNTPTETTPNVFNPETRRFEPAATEAPRPLGTTIPGGAETTPDGQRAPQLETPTPTPAAPVTDPTNPYATMGWEEINTLRADRLSPDERAQLTQRVQQLLTEGNLPKGAEPNEKNATEFLNKFAETNAAKEEDIARNTAYVEISRILLEPTMDLAPSGVNVQELAYTANNPIELAEQFLGYNEVAQRDTLASFFRRAVGSDFDPVELPWCARFVNAVLRTAGYNTDGADDWARSFMRVGEATTSPRRGDVVVMERGGNPENGHVGFFYGFDDAGNVLILGGNQGNEVNISSYSVDDVLGYRRFTL